MESIGGFPTVDRCIDSYLFNVIMAMEMLRNYLSY
jgi:hypothetical protein